MKKLIMALLLACSLIGMSGRPQADVEITIQFPYSGYYNEWIVTFTNRVPPYDQYQFETTLAQYPNGVPGQSGILGIIPEGNYDIEFNSPYSSDQFDYDLFTYTRSGYGYHTFYNVPVANPDTYLIIDGPQGF
jgi:hypothetical protein